MSRTISTARIGVVSSMGCHLTRRVDSQRPIPSLDVHAVEHLDLVKPNNVPKVPAHNDIDAGHRREGDVQHVIAVPCPKNPVTFVRLDQANDLLGGGDPLTKRGDLPMQVSNSLGCLCNLDRRDVRQNRPKEATPKILDQPIRPESELGVEAPPSTEVST